MIRYRYSGLTPRLLPDSVTHYLTDNLYTHYSFNAILTLSILSSKTINRMQSGMPPRERERVEELRRRMNISFDEFLESGYDAVALHSSSILLAVNQAGLDMFGYSEDEIIFMNAWQLFTTESANALMHHLLKKSEDAYTVTAIHKDGTTFDVELKGRDFECCGEPVRVVLIRRI